MRIVTTSEMPLLSAGTLILVRLEEDPTAPAHVWEVLEEGRAVIVDESYPNGETEDVEHFAPASIYVIGSIIPF